MSLHFGPRLHVHRSVDLTLGRYVRAEIDKDHGRVGVYKDWSSDRFEVPSERGHDFFNFLLRANNIHKGRLKLN